MMNIRITAVQFVLAALAVSAQMESDVPSSSPTFMISELPTTPPLLMGMGMGELGGMGGGMGEGMGGGMGEGMGGGMGGSKPVGPMSQ